MLNTNTKTTQGLTSKRRRMTLNAKVIGGSESLLPVALLPVALSTSGGIDRFRLALASPLSLNLKVAKLY